MKHGQGLFPVRLLKLIKRPRDRDSTGKTWVYRLYVWVKDGKGNAATVTFEVR